MLLNPWGSCFTSEKIVTQPSTLCLNALSTSQRMNAGCAEAHWLLVVSLGKLPVASISAIRARGASQTWGARPPLLSPTKHKLVRKLEPLIQHCFILSILNLTNQDQFSNQTIVLSRILDFLQTGCNHFNIDVDFVWVSKLNRLQL